MINEIMAFVLAQIHTLTGLPEAQVHLVDPIGTNPDLLPDVEIFRLKDLAIEDVTDSGGCQLRGFSFGVAIAVKSKEQDATEPLAQQVKQAILTDYTLGGLVQDCRWEGQEWGTGQQSAGVAMTSLTFTAIYPYYRPSNW